LFAPGWIRRAAASEPRQPGLRRRDRTARDRTVRPPPSGRPAAPSPNTGPPGVPKRSPRRRVAATAM